MVKLIHPKTGVVREVEGNPKKVEILARAGFVPVDKYRPKKNAPPPPTLADMVEAQSEEVAPASVEIEAEIAIHAESQPIPKPTVLMTAGARELIEERDLDANAISHKGDKIFKADVLDYLGE
jgi:hypothetical protein